MSKKRKPDEMETTSCEEGISLQPKKGKSEVQASGLIFSRSSGMLGGYGQKFVPPKPLDKALLTTLNRYIDKTLTVASCDELLEPSVISLKKLKGEISKELTQEKLTDIIENFVKILASFGSYFRNNEKAAMEASIDYQIFYEHAIRVAREILDDTVKKNTWEVILSGALADNLKIVEQRIKQSSDGAIENERQLPILKKRSDDFLR